MIIIIGNTNDDILYFSSILKNKKEETVLNRYTAYTGEIYNQEVILVKDVYSSYVSSMIVSNLITKYMAILVISVGRCAAYSKNLRIGDICISRSVICGDVNISDYENVGKGRIPGFPQIFPASIEIVEALQKSLQTLTLSRAYNCSFIGYNSHVDSTSELAPISENERIFGMPITTVFSSEVGGVAVACAIHDVPYVAIQVVGNKIGEKASFDSYLEVLKRYINVGKAVTSVIGEIGRSDILGE